MKGSRFLAVGLATGLLGGRARADNATSAAAQVLYAQGKKLMAEGKFAEACPKLEESQHLEPGGGTILLLARCHAKQGRIASAWTEYEEGRRVALRDNRSDREKVARVEGSALEPRLSTLAVEVNRLEVANGETVRRDQEIVGAAQWSLPVPIDPGRHVVDAAAPGHASWTQTVDVIGEGKAFVVRVPKLALSPVASAPVAPPAEPVVAVTPVTDPTSVGGSNAQRIGAVVVGGAGIALLAAGGFFALKAKSSYDASRSDCGSDGSCGDGALMSRNDAFSKARVATVLVSAGAAGLAGGAILWLTAPTNEERSVRLGIGPGQLMMKGAW